VSSCLTAHQHNMGHSVPFSSKGLRAPLYAFSVIEEFQRHMILTLTLRRGPYGTPTYQISFESEKLFCERTYVRTYARIDIEAVLLGRLSRGVDLTTAGPLMRG